MYRDRLLDASRSNDPRAVQRLPAPGKQSLTGALPAGPGPAAQDPVHAAAARGTATASTALPFRDQIQRAFGRHDVSRIQAHVGGEAGASARAMGAEAYATGDHVVLGDGADLHTVAHEAAHVVQQRGGVQLAGGVGAVGDRHEQHADAVADLVVKGEPAEALLDAHAGGGAAASAPVQRKWSRMSTRFDANDDHEVNQINAQVGVGNYVAAFRLLLGYVGGPLARFNTIATAYTNAGRLAVITAALQHTFQQPGKAYAAWEILDEVEGGAPARLEQLFAGRRVIIAGETHGDPEAGAIEATLLPLYGVAVRSENQAIASNAGTTTPDPPAFRLLYMLEAFYEELLQRRTNHGSQPHRQHHLAQMDYFYGRYQHEYNNYSQAAIEQSASYQGHDIMSYARLTQLRTTLYNTLCLVESRPHDATVYQDPLIAKVAPGLIDKFDDLKQASGHANNEPVMRKLRSDRMFEALQHDLAGAARTVYKVGNNHIADIRARAQNLAWVLDEAQYKAIFRL